MLAKLKLKITRTRKAVDFVQIRTLSRGELFTIAGTIYRVESCKEFFTFAVAILHYSLRDGQWIVCNCGVQEFPNSELVSEIEVL